MKKAVLILIICILAVLSLAACGKSEVQTSEKGDVIFCENVDSDGNPINASSKFEAGEVYVLFKTATPRIIK